MDNKDTRNIGTARESSVYEADPHHAQTETLVEHSVTQLQVVDDDVVHRTPHSQRSSQDRAFHWSVKIVPPDEAIMSRHVFGDIIYSSIKGMLASDSAGNQFSWPDRGWRNEGEFRSEWRAAMRTEHGHVHVSRAQTFEEATQLKTDLASLQIQAEVEQIAFPTPLGGARRPPPRFNVDNEATTSCGPAGGEKECKVMLFLTHSSPTELETVAQTFINSDIDFLRGPLGAGDPEGDHPGNYSWDERGWTDGRHFETNTRESLRTKGFCILGRNLTVREARVLTHRMGQMDTQVPITVRCFGPAPGMEPLSEAPSVPEIAPSARSPRRGSRRRAEGDGGEENEFLAHLLRDLERHAGGANSKHGASKDAIKGLPRFTMTSEMLEAEREERTEMKGDNSSKYFCSICQEDIKEGEHFTKLPCCDHIFHIQPDSGDSAEDSSEHGEYCSGISTWLEKCNECPCDRLKVFSSEEVGDVGTDWTCLGCSTVNRRGAGEGGLARLLMPHQQCTLCRARDVAPITGQMGPLVSESRRLLAHVRSVAQQHASPQASGGSSSHITALAATEATAARIGKFLESPLVAGLENGGWEVRASLETMLRAPLTGDYQVPLVHVDTNSRAVVRWLARQLSHNLPEGQQYECIPIPTETEGSPRSPRSPRSTREGSSTTLECTRCNIPMRSAAHGGGGLALLMQRAGHECERCGADSRAVRVTQGQQLRPIEKRVVAILKLQQQIQSRAPSAGASTGTPSEVASAVAAFLASPELQAAQRGGWMLEAAFRHILRNVSSFPTIEVALGTIDSNSAVCVCGLIRNINRALGVERIVVSDRAVDAPIRGGVAPEVLVPPAGSWTCPRCECAVEASAGREADEDDDDEMGDEELRGLGRLARMLEASQNSCRQCGTGMQVLHRSGDLGPILDALASLFEKHRRDGRLSQTEVSAFLNGSAITDFTQSGWNLKDACAQMLSPLTGASASVAPTGTATTASTSQPQIEIRLGTVDPNSSGLICCLVKSLNERLALASATSPTVVTILDRVTVMNEEDRLVQEFFSPTLTLQFPPRPQTRAFISKTPVLVAIAKAIASGGREAEWDGISRVVLPRLERGGWTVSVAVQMMRVGVRDVRTLAQDLDRGSSSVVEFLLFCVNKLEDVEANSPRGPSRMQRQPSIGTLTTQHLQDMVRKMPLSDLKELLPKLRRVLDNIRREPSNAQYRVLKKSNVVVQRLFLSNEEVVGILTSVGFTEFDDRLEIVTVDIDAVSRCLRALDAEIVRLG